MPGITAKSPQKQTRTVKKDVSGNWEPFYPFLIFFFALFSEFSLFSFDQGELGSHNNLFGKLGHYYSYLLFWILGRAAYMVPFLSVCYGVILFQRKDVKPEKLVLSAPILIASVSVLANIFETNIFTLRDGGGSLGLLISNLLEYIIGKSGRMIVSIASTIYGSILLVREFPKKINKEYWAQFFQKHKEKLFTWANPSPIIEKPTEEEPTSKEYISIQNAYEDLPWIEVKKVSRGKKFPNVSDLTDEESTIDPLKEPINPFQNENDRINQLKQSIEKTKSKLDREKIIDDEPTNWIDNESINFKFESSPKTLINKIKPIEEEIAPNYENAYTMEAESLTSNDWEEEIISSNKAEENSFLDDDKELVTVEELEGLLYADGEVQESTIEPVELGPSLDEKDNFPEDNDNLIESEETTYTTPMNDEEKQSRLAFGSMVPTLTYFKKGTYKISPGILKTNVERRPNPMYKMEAEYISKKITEIIKDFGYESTIVEWQKGPIVTRYELSPPTGVKLSRFTSLSDELKLHLSAKSIRIVAPIPGKSTIGIEVPNKYREDVLLGDIIKEKKDSIINDQLNLILGKDSISGEVITINLTTLPHLLVAGTTGSGKSVSMNSMISFLIYSKSPEDVRFIMIDPKMVEMSLYQHIPHLLLPVITDPRKAPKALNWAVQEMEARYALISDLKCRDIRAYNEKVNTHLLSRIKHKKMPYIVIFIDELNDLMMVSGKELEEYITRISQKARAVGIHLVMATQRPSVDVITGLIKANCPARIAFHVAQKNDSKIILDYSGADTLLGKGDLLYKSPTSADLQRIQAPYVSEEEIERIVAEAMTFAKSEYVNINLDEESFKEETNEDDEADFEKAWNIVRTERKASSSYIQRRMRIGYNKAARLMELMEERGYVGPQIGAKPREILR
jgi:DNA segregation ATPase FtsK/SpoIIIE, S-DNA-T family